MSAAPKDGGPAFPVNEPDIDTFKFKTADELRRLMSGMTLRDYFAAKAMQAVVGSVEWEFNGKPMNTLEATDTALMSYQLADAMLKARQS